MKRVFLFILSFFLSCSVVFAAVVIEAEGSGKTLGEAKENARIALAEKVFPGTIVVETTTATSDSSNGDYSASFSQKSSYSIVGEFPGFDYTVVSSKKNKYVVSTRIVGDTATLNFYTNKLDEQKENVEEFYSRYISLAPNVSATERREALALVIEYYYYYNMYSNIILSLGGTTTDVDIPVTLAVLQVDYQSLLDEEQNELLTKSSVSAITQEIREELTKNEEAQEEYRKAQEEAKAQAELQRRLILDQRIADIVNRADVSTLLNADSSLGSGSFCNYLDVIGTANDSLLEACDEYDDLVEEQSTAIYSSFEEEADAIRNRTYPLAHQADGKPTAYAEALREKEVDALWAEKEQEKKDAVDTINSKLGAEIQKRYDYLVEAVNQMEEKEFVYSSDEYEVSLSSVPKYDGNNFCWEFDVTVTSLGTSFFTIKAIKLDYSTLTGTSVPEDKNELEEFYLSTEYQDTVETYTRLLQSGQFDFSVAFKMDFDFSSKVYISFSYLEMVFTDGMKARISLEECPRLFITIDWNGSDYLSYSWLETGDEIESRENGSSSPSSSTDISKSDGNSFFSSLKLGLSIDGQALLMVGNPFFANDTVSKDFAVEGKVFFYGFYISVSANITILDVSDLLVNTNTLTQYGVFFGAGYRLPKLLSIGMRMSVSRDLGVLLMPYMSFGFDFSSFRVEMIGELYVNSKTGNIGFGYGFGYGWRAF